MNKKAKIVIASVLKPVNDVRMYEKIGLTLHKAGHEEITLCGTGNTSKDELALASKEWRTFTRLSIGRFLVQLQFWKVLMKTRPSTMICCTHELLITSVVFKIFFGCKLICDVQEDYLKTLWYQTNYPPIIRHGIGLGIRLVELLASPFINRYFLAEQVYFEDMSFVRKKALVLENKSLPIPKKEIQTKQIRFLFSGTLSDYSRTKESIDLFLALKSHLDNAEMVVIGHCPSSQYYKELRANYEDKVKLVISTEPIPHEDIVNEISKADIGIIGYLPNPVNQRKVPTKLYEYTAAELPYLVQKETHWSELGTQLGGAIPVDFLNPDLNELVRYLTDKAPIFFDKQGFLWIENERLLLNDMNQL